MHDLTKDEELVLRRLGDGEIVGYKLRLHLRANGRWYTGPGFYALMGRMEEDGLVTHEDRTRSVAGHTINARYYRRTREGHFALAGSPDATGRESAGQGEGVLARGRGSV